MENVIARQRPVVLTKKIMDVMFGFETW